MRALMMDFADDKKTWDINDQYMFGSSFLVAPVLHAQYATESGKQLSADEGWNAENKGTAVANGWNVDFTRQNSTTLYLPSGTAW